MRPPRRSFNLHIASRLESTPGPCSPRRTPHSEPDGTAPPTPTPDRYGSPAHPQVVASVAMRSQSNRSSPVRRRRAGHRRAPVRLRLQYLTPTEEPDPLMDAHQAVPESMYDPDYPASVTVSVQIPLVVGGQHKPISQSFKVTLPVATHLANHGARHWNAVDTDLAAAIALTWRGLQETVTLERSSTDSLIARSLKGYVQKAFAVIVHSAKSVSDDIVLFAGAQRHDAALARCRKLFECWLHAALLHHFGDGAAAIYLSSDHQTSRSLSQARAADSALRGEGPPLTPLVEAARQRLAAAGHPADFATDSPYWWLHAWNGLRLRTDDEALKYILKHSPPASHRNKAFNERFLTLLKSMRQYTHMSVHADPAMMCYEYERRAASQFATYHCDPNAVRTALIMNYAISQLLLDIGTRLFRHEPEVMAALMVLANGLAKKIVVVS